MAQCGHQDDEGKRCTARKPLFDVTSAHPYREWLACERHARECEREGCEVSWDEEEVA